MSIARPDQGDWPTPGTPLTDPAPEAAAGQVAGSRRSSVLEVLAGADAPVTAAAVAEQTGLPLNTARFHLEGLVEAGLAERRPEARGTRGRPRVLYVTTGDGSRSYRLLSSMLVSLVGSLEGHATVATDAGREWGRRLVAASPAGESPPDDALGALHDLMGRVGFQPATRPDGVPEMHLHHCPFIEVVDGAQDVVCALHLGLMRGALEATGGAVEVAELVPFATPDACVARLRETGHAGARQGG